MCSRAKHLASRPLPFSKGMSTILNPYHLPPPSTPTAPAHAAAAQSPAPRSPGRHFFSHSAQTKPLSPLAAIRSRISWHGASPSPISFNSLPPCAGRPSCARAPAAPFRFRRRLRQAIRRQVDHPFPSCLSASFVGFLVADKTQSKSRPRSESFPVSRTVTFDTVSSCRVRYQLYPVAGKSRLPEGKKKRQPENSAGIEEGDRIVRGIGKCEC